MGNTNVHLSDYYTEANNVGSGVSKVATASFDATASKRLGARDVGRELHVYHFVAANVGNAGAAFRWRDSADGVAFADLFVSPTIELLASQIYIARMNAEALKDGRPFVQLVVDVIGGTSIALVQYTVIGSLPETPLNGVHVIRSPLTPSGQGTLENDAGGNPRVIADYPASVGL